jgi:hypothetical protein
VQTNECALDTDLNDDMLKLVRWRVLWTEPDHEASLANGEEFINYRTDSCQYGGQIMVAFIGRAQDPNSSEHAALTRVVPDGVSGLTADNRRYLRAEMEVLSRQAKEEPRYDQRQTEAMEEIAERLKRMA